MVTASIGCQLGRGTLRREDRPSAARHGRPRTARSLRLEPPRRSEPSGPGRSSIARTVALSTARRDLEGLACRRMPLDWRDLDRELARSRAQTGSAAESWLRTRAADPDRSRSVPSLTILQRKAVEQVARAPAVGVDLRSQRVERLERALVAQPLHEADAEPPAVQVPSRVEARASRLTRWPDSPTVGRTPMLVTDGCRSLADPGGRRVDAVRRQQLVVGPEVRRRKPDAAAAPVGLDHGAVDEVRDARAARRLRRRAPRRRGGGCACC